MRTGRRMVTGDNNTLRIERDRANVRLMKSIIGGMSIGRKYMLLYVNVFVTVFLSTATPTVLLVALCTIGVVGRI